MGSCLFDFGVVLGYFMSPPQLESFRYLGPSCVAGPVFLRRARQINSAYLRGALSLVGFIAVCDFIHVSHEIIAQIHKHPSSVCCSKTDNPKLLALPLLLTACI